MNRNNDLLRRVVTANLQAIVEKAELEGFDEMKDELDRAFGEADQRIAALEARIDQLEAQQPIAKAEQLEAGREMQQADIR